jgi:TonB-dependent receptor
VDLIKLPYRNLGAAGLNGNTVTVYTGGTNLADFVAALNTPNASHVPAGGYPLLPSATAPTQAGAQMPGQATGVAGARIGITGTNGQARNKLDAFQADAERDVVWGPLMSIRVGLRYEHNRYTSSASRNTALGASVQAVGQDQSVASPYSQDFFNGQADGYTQAWRSVDVSRVLAAITPANIAPRSVSNPNGLPGQFVFDPSAGVFLTPFGLVNNYADPNYWNGNFKNTTTVFSGYVMAKASAQVGGITIRGNAGLRYERTRQVIDALDCVNCVNSLAGVAAPPINHRLVDRSYRNDYDYLLPSAMFVADLTRTLKLRGAYYRTYVRPQPRDNVPVTFVQQPETLNPPVDPVYTVQIGATRLKPYTADSFDVALEWYNRPGGLLAVSLFQKNVQGYIGPITDPEQLCPANGLINGVDLGLGNLAVDGPNCVSSKRFAGAANTLVNARVLASGITNQLPFRVRGAEFAVQQNLDFLPGPLRHLGAAANYTYVDVSGSDASGNPLTLPSVARHTINLVAYYEQDRFGVRLTYNHRGDYELAAGNSFVGDARTVKARGQLDASASLNISQWLSLSVDAFNLTDATRAEYENDPMLPRRLDYDGRTYRATLRADF